MAVQGKKINELTAIGTVSDETVLPAVYVSGTTVNSSANKISIEQISTKVQNDMSTVLSGKQDTLIAGENITIENNTISAQVPDLPENVLTTDKVHAGDNITIEEDSDEGIVISSTGGSVPENIWTQDNLVAGENITITKQINPNICNPETTLGIWHLDGDATNSVTTSNPYNLVFDQGTIDSNLHYLDNGTAKFGTKYFQNYSIFGPASQTYTSYTTAKSIDWWYKCDKDFWNSNILHIGGFYILRTATTTFSVTYADSEVANFTYNLFDGNWHHIAISITLSKFVLFIDGQKMVNVSRSGNIGTYSANETNYLVAIFFQSCYNTTSGIDEVRCTDADLYSELDSFTPPTQPYVLDTDPQDVYEINALAADTSLSNLTDDGKNQVALLGGPDGSFSRKISFTVSGGPSGSGQFLKAPVSGFLCFQLLGGGGTLKTVNNFRFYVFDKSVQTAQETSGDNRIYFDSMDSYTETNWYVPSTSNGQTKLYPIAKDQAIVINCDNYNGNTVLGFFIPNEGSKVTQ